MDHNLKNLDQMDRQAPLDYIESLEEKTANLEEKMEDLKAQVTTTKKALKALDQVRVERIKNTTKRRDLGSSLYEQIVKLCHYGKTYWKDRDKERYKKYLLYAKGDE